MEYKNNRWNKAQKAEWEMWDHSSLWTNKEEIRKRNINYLCQHTKLSEEELKKLRILEIGGPVVENAFNDQTITDKYVLDPLFPWDSNLGENTTAISCIHRIRGMAENITLHDHSIDLCICINVIDHTSSPIIVLNEIRRILIENGLLVISCDLVADWAKPLIPLFNIFDAPHPHHFTLGMFKKLLLRGRFGIQLQEEDSNIIRFSLSNSIKLNVAAFFKVKHIYFNCTPIKFPMS
jgi:SAM-dependent methyltransferase